MTTQKKSNEIIFKKDANELHVKVVDAETKETMLNHGIKRINWDDGDISSTFFPKPETKPERTFLFRKKGILKVEFADQSFVEIEVV